MDKGGPRFKEEINKDPFYEDKETSDLTTNLD